MTVLSLQRDIRFLGDNFAWIGRTLRCRVVFSDDCPCWEFVRTFRCGVVFSDYGPYCLPYLIIGLSLPSMESIKQPLYQRSLVILVTRLLHTSMVSSILTCHVKLKKGALKFLASCWIPNWHIIFIDSYTSTIYHMAFSSLLTCLSI